MEVIIHWNLKVDYLRHAFVQFDCCILIEWEDAEVHVFNFTGDK